MLEEKVQKEENPILDIVVASLEDGKVEDMVVIDLRGKTSIANEMVVASGNSDRHVISLAQRETRNRSSEFAKCLVDEMRKSVKLINDTHRFAGFAVLKAPDVPSVLLEMGYLSNKNEERLLRQESYRRKLAASAVRAIDCYFEDMKHKSLF